MITEKKPNKQNKNVKRYGVSYMTEKRTNDKARLPYYHVEKCQINVLNQIGIAPNVRF
jgi:hypothetical protein